MRAYIFPTTFPGRMVRILRDTSSSGCVVYQSKRVLKSFVQQGRCNMPFIQCDLEAGLSDQEKRELVAKMTEVTHKAIGSAYGHINVVLREHPSSNLGEAGEADRRLISTRVSAAGSK